MNKLSNTTKKISVIIPIYNCEDYLSECIESILAQSYTNLEILLVDDGSTDKSGLICDEYAAKDSRIKVFHQENGGVSKARNTGLDHMSDDAELVSFIDSDDYIAVSALAHLTKAMEEEQSDMAISTIIGVENTKQGRKCTPIPFKHITAGSYTKEEIIKRSLSSGGHTYRMATHKLYRRSLFQEIRFKEGKIHEDEWIAYKLLLSCERISLVDDAEYYYRYRSNSIMDQPYSEKNLQMVKAHIHNANLLIDEGYTEEAKLFLPRIVLEYCRACYKLKKHYPDIATSSRNVIKRVKDAHMLSRTEGIAYRISLRYPRFFYLLLKTSKSIINKIR